MTRTHQQSIELTAYTMALLQCEDRYLMIRRSDDKGFAPGQWTGIGGRVEAHEFDAIHHAAQREIREETGIEPESVSHFTLRRTLLQQGPGYPITILLYFTGETRIRDIDSSDEGSLHWLSEDELSRIDVIENTRLVIPLLIDDMQRDPDGTTGIVTGAASYSLTGELRSIVWAE